MTVFICLSMSIVYGCLTWLIILIYTKKLKVISRKHEQLAYEYRRLSDFSNVICDENIRLKNNAIDGDDDA